MTNYIVQQAILSVLSESEFCPAWVLSEEQLFKFFNDDVHDQIKDGLEEGNSSFHIYSGELKYRISVPTLPFYM